MAQAAIKSTQLRLIFETGIDRFGNPVYRNKSFNNVKPDATPDALYAIATALVPLQEHSLFEIERNDSSTLEG
ncbi:hypothetical protein DCC39_13755 [Pueribacillus theae]|uniref:DUF1659 domain-containing protein n=1 Tax=Pueribacillus theae TaxID=2171751 RepID=A0A2U1JW33_9BACI|nr:DUF1659 domain-containing protein [Pueribacillus theae]PWA09028.1 hypothetical protein DCC39_13755 [Pueribacillus theae]